MTYFIKYLREDGSFHSSEAVLAKSYRDAERHARIVRLLKASISHYDIA